MTNIVIDVTHLLCISIIQIWPKHLVYRWFVSWGFIGRCVGCGHRFLSGATHKKGVSWCCKSVRWVQTLPGLKRHTWYDQQWLAPWVACEAGRTGRSWGTGISWTDPHKEGGVGGVEKENEVRSQPSIHSYPLPIATAYCMPVIWQINTTLVLHVVWANS